tara:strand:- start:460 stop:1572 length:1113 start_codon:yes stop_codon:yes gene_type:complete
MSELKKLSLHHHHLRMGAKFTPFAGWNMPLSYGSSLNEHLAVRESAGLFDVSHMGEIEVIGDQAEEFLNYALTNDVRKCKIGQAQYSILCSENGCTLDDLIIYRMSEDKFFLCVNAANIEIDYQTLLKRSEGFGCSVNNISLDYGQLAFQGPDSEAILSEIIDRDLSILSKMHFIVGDWMGFTSILARTGYTGEDGFEIYCKCYDLPKWLKTFESQAASIPWIGLAARDSLRLEAGFPLYGHELSENITPLQAGLTWVIGWDKPKFIGADALAKEKENQPASRVVHYLVNDRRIPREGCLIIAPDNEIVGKVLSGGYSPLHKKPTGSALIKNSYWSKQNDQGWHALVRENKLPIDLGSPALRRAIDPSLG